jgi:hypothetical protein
MARDKSGSKACVICKYDFTKTCGISFEKNCTNGGYCSKDPNRFEGKAITKGQSIFLIERGYKEEELLNLSQEEAGEEIRRIKQESPIGTFKVWS